MCSSDNPVVKAALVARDIMNRVSSTELSTHLRVTCVEEVTFAARLVGAAGTVATVTTCETLPVPRALLAVSVTGNKPVVLKT
jgi:hypothetical protein